MRFVSIILIIALLSGQVLASTQEAVLSPPNFLQETDIVFWQTLPFATFWSYVLERSASSVLFPGVGPHWPVIIGLAVVISGGNAVIQAQKVMKDERTGHH